MRRAGALRPHAHTASLRRIRWRVAISAGLVVGCLLAFLAAGVYLLAEREAHRQLENRLLKMAWEGRHLGEPGGYLVFDEHDHLLRSGPPPEDAGVGGVRIVTDRVLGPLAVLTLPLAPDGPRAVAVTAVADLRTLDALRRALAGMTAAGAGAALLLGYVLAGLALRPLDEAVRERSEFVTLASHHLRTPLSVIRTSAELAQANLNVTPQEAMGVILDQTRRMETLAVRLTALARAESGSRRSRARTDLAAAVEDVCAALRPAADQAGVTLAWTGDPVCVRADLLDVGALLEPVVENAIKFSSAGTRVAIDVRRSGRSAIVEVTDQGPGIPAEDLAHVTEPFFRGDRRRGGFGLGLAIARAVAERHRGSLLVSSVPGEGTRVRIVLPADHDVRAAVSAALPEGTSEH